MSHSSEARKSKIEMPANCVWCDLSSQTQCSRCVLMGQKGWESPLEPLLGSILMGPKPPPPNAITLGARISTQGLGGGHKYSVHNTQDLSAASSDT